MDVCVYVCMHVCVCVLVCACMWVCVCACVRVYVCMCASCMCIPACVCDDGVNGLCSFVLLYHHSYAKSCLNVMVPVAVKRIVKLMHLYHTHVHRQTYTCTCSYPDDLGDGIHNQTLTNSILSVSSSV